ncbi:hypothetical protein NKG94_48055 [Micromonospora sp. M12]
MQWAFFRPQAAVDGYFSALADRDSEAALGFLTDQGAGADRKLLAQLLRGRATSHRPTSRSTRWSGTATPPPLRWRTNWPVRDRPPRSPCAARRRPPPGCSTVGG